MVRAGALLLSGLAIFGPAPVAAQTIVSGEHDTFSRLVFPASRSVEWEVNRTGDRAAITFSGVRFDFDLGQVFQRIPRDRLEDISATSDGLDLELNCNCDLEIFQIPSGHVVVDIIDPSNETEVTQNVPRPAPIEVGLPLVLGATPALDLRLRLPEGNTARPSAPPQSEPVASLAAEVEPETVPQVVLREHARIGLLSDLSSTVGADRQPACPLEEVAIGILMADPREALEKTPAVRAAIIDEEGQDDRAMIRDLARAYLEAGWGAEAAKTLMAIAAAPDDPYLTIANALDGDPGLINPELDASPACGPATVLLLLINGAMSADWDNVDEEELVRLIDRMPVIRRSDLEPRIRSGLAQVGKEDLLLRLGRLPEPNKKYVPASQEAVAAGTGHEAVRASIELISSENGVQNIETAHLQNALALLPSVPAGSLRKELEKELLRTLALTGHLSEMTRLLEKAPDQAGPMLTFALENLPREAIVETAIRLRPFLRSDAEGIPEVVEVMLDFGLRETAQDFRAIRTGEGLEAPLPARLPLPAPSEGLEDLPANDQAWIERSLIALAASDDSAESSPRTAVAAAIVRRNQENVAAGDDFTQAQNALEGSRELSAVLRDLMALEARP